MCVYVVSFSKISHAQSILLICLAFAFVRPTFKSPSTHSDHQIKYNFLKVDDGKLYVVRQHNIFCLDFERALDAVVVLA